MTKPEWGAKRECTECGARFYDLKRTPIVCPKCEATIVIQTAKPSAKSRAKPAAPALAAPAPAAALAEPEADGEAVDDEATLLSAVGIEEKDSDNSEQDGAVGDVFVEDDDEDDDVSNVLHAPSAPIATE